MAHTIKKINERVKGAGEVGISHDSRRDVRTLAKVVNTLIDKINEIVDVVNELDNNTTNPKTEPHAK